MLAIQLNLLRGKPQNPYNDSPLTKFVAKINDSLGTALKHDQSKIEHCIRDATLDLYIWFEYVT